MKLPNNCLGMLYMSHFQISHVFADPHFEKTGWQPPNLKICPKETWNDRMMIETVLSMLTLICRFKKVGHPVWDYFKSRVNYTMTLFYILVQWYGLRPDADRMIHLSIAKFSS